MFPVWNYWQSEWLFYHKVTFDPFNKLIIINPEVYEINVQEDIYTAWVQWQTLEDHTKWEFALRFTGGDPTTGTQSSGLIFFLINGWRIYTDHAVNFAGSLFSDDYVNPIITSNNGYVVTSVVSSLVTQVETNSGGSGTYPTIAEIAAAVWSYPDATALPAEVRDEVWSANMASYNVAGTFGHYVKNKLLNVAKFIGLG
jgi:hypothetical protein